MNLEQNQKSPQLLQNEIDIGYESSNLMLPNKNKFSALHYACKNGSKETVEILVSNDNINIDEIDNTGSTPLYYAVERQDTEIIQILVDHGADPLHRNLEGKSILSLAKSKEIMTILRNAISNSDIFKKRKEVTNKIANGSENKHGDDLNPSKDILNSTSNFDDPIKLDFSSSDDENIFHKRNHQNISLDYNEFQEEEEEEEYMEMTETEENEFFAFKQGIESKIDQMQTSMVSQISEMITAIKILIQKKNELMKAESKKSSKKP